MDSLSPELALVDPDAAASTRDDAAASARDDAAASARNDAAASTRDAPRRRQLSSTSREAALAVRPAPGDARAPARDGAVTREGFLRRSSVATILGLVVVIVFGLQHAAPSRAPVRAGVANASRPSPSKVERSTPARTKGTTRSHGITIRWPATRGADLYNVVLLRNGKRIDLWPTSNVVAVNGSGVKRSRYVPAGTYRWYSYPGFREGGRVRYGKLLAHGRVRIPSQY